MSTTRDEFVEHIVSLVSSAIGIPGDEIDVRDSFTSYGLDSMAAVSIAGSLEAIVGAKLPSTLLWDYPSTDALADRLVELTRR